MLHEAIVIFLKTWHMCSHTCVSKDVFKRYSYHVFKGCFHLVSVRGKEGFTNERNTKKIQAIKLQRKWENYFFFFNTSAIQNYLQCFIGGRIPKQSSSLSSPREMNDSSSSSSFSEELATDGSDLEARSCCITLKYSSSVFALANRDWVFVLWARKVL